MADLHIKKLEEKVAHYEAVMSRCPQCKKSLSAPEVESTTASFRHTRSSRSAQQSAAKTPPSAPTESSKQPTPESTLSVSARSSHQRQSASATDLQAKNLQRYPPPAPPTASSSRSRESTESVVSTLQGRSTKSSDHRDARAVSSSATDPLDRPTSSSQAASTHDSSPGLSVADGRHPHSGTLVALDLQQYNNRNRGGRPPGESPRHAEWMRTADIMLEEVPSGRNWREKVMEMDSSIIAAVAIGAVSVSKGDVSLTEDDGRKELVRLVRRFAERHSEGRLNFQQFILVCLCQVLSSQGVTQGKIVETLQICISDTSKRNVGRFLKGATWANKMVNDLFFTDWGYRAVDLIAIWNRSVATYGTLAVAPASRQYFITDLTQRKYFEGYQEVPDRRHDTIPWIVKKELGDEVSYREICEALDYGDEYFMETKQLHSSSPLSPDLSAGGSGDVSSNSRRGSCPSASQARSQANTGTSSLHQQATSPTNTGTSNPHEQATSSASTGTPSLHQPKSVDEAPSNYPFSASYLQDMSLRRKQLHQDDSTDDAAGSDPPTSQNVAPQIIKRLVPDRSAKPLGDPDVARRRKKPAEVTSSSISSGSLGESAPGTESAKRPLPESPTSALQPASSSRRRQDVQETSSREETSPSSRRPDKKGSKDQRGRA